MNRQWLLVLPLKINLKSLALLIFLSLASAQSSNNTSEFVLSVQETVFLCESAVLSWSGGDTVPLYEVWYARGYGTIGDDNFLWAEEQLATVNATQFEWLVVPGLANSGDVLRFRVQERSGQGVNATAWSTVGESMCMEGGTDTNTSFVPYTDTAELTTKNTNVQAQTAGLLTPSANAPSLTRDGVSSSQRPSPASPGAQNSNQSDPPSPTNPPWSNTEANPAGIGSLSRVASGAFSGVNDGATANQPQANRSERNGQQASQSSRTALPSEQNEQDTSSQKEGSLSPQAIGAIVGTICVASVVWLWFLLWRRKRRRRPIALVPKESPTAGSTRELLSDPSPTLSHGPTMVTAPIHPQTQLLTVPPAATSHGRPRIPSYDEATGLYSPLDSPDPFRHSYNMIQAPGDPRP